MPNQFSHPWTVEEINYIKQNIRKLTYAKMGEKINRSYSSIQSKIRYLPFQKKIKKYSINSYFFGEWTAKMAYVLGFIAADGNVYKIGRIHSLHIACDDLDIIEKIQKVIKHKGIIHKKGRENGKISNSLRICDPFIFNDLIKLGITERKSLTFTPPNIPAPYVHHFIRGYFDGDGSVSSRNNKYPNKLVVDIYTASKNMANFLYKTIAFEMGNAYNGRLYIATTHQKTKYYAVRLGHKSAVKLFKYMYKDANGLYLKRKYDKFLTGIDL